jgi:NAD(P)-dependent dehydrogenase (short-subunit alcohol dehydrogenase family)
VARKTIKGDDHAFDRFEVDGVGAGRCAGARGTHGASGRRRCGEAISVNAGALVVTGGGRGIGAEIARAAARAGTPVALFYRSRADVAARVVGEIEAGGGRALAIQADVGDERDVRRAFEAVDAALGPVGGLVNNAVDPGPGARLADLGLDEVERVFRTNVFGAFLCAREAVRRMSTRQGGGGGAIVAMSSLIAVKTGAPGNWVHFAASKGALEVLSLGLAREVAAEGIRVNVVRAGVIATETRLAQRSDWRDRALAQVPLGRMGTPAEAATAALWLLSPQASYVVGTVLEVGGGL